LWLPHTFKTPGTATILFTARGQHIRLLFTDDKNVDNLDKDAYLFCIGVDANKETYFKRKVGGGDKKPFVTAKQNPNAMASPLVWGDYWVTINQGDIRFGRGTDTTKEEVVEMRFKDPNPIPFLYFAISNWTTGIEFRNLCVLDK